ncbi:hypothetical protein POTOM_047750 [Populus tomentosa]|uniref:Uncharacterized protein n=1 Tax=Populus tomentosa TaxID=118781 RepID=A0A8X8C9X4_POPTO|nr:hypothetical protein POTOM_047750 [Populus tomentosa]
MLLLTVSPLLIFFVARTTSSREAWHVLATTYAKPSRGRIKHIKNQLKNLTKGTMNITDFVYFVKARSEELAVLSAPMDIEDLIEKILDGLDDEYKELVLLSKLEILLSLLMSFMKSLSRLKLRFKASHVPQVSVLSLPIPWLETPTTAIGDLHDLTGDHRSILWGTAFTHQPPTFDLLCQLLLQIMVATVDCLHVLIWDIVKFTVFKDTLQNDVLPFICIGSLYTISTMSCRCSFVYGFFTMFTSTFMLHYRRPAKHHYLLFPVVTGTSFFLST